MTGELIFFDLPRPAKPASQEGARGNLPLSPPETGPTPFGPAAAFACAALQCDPEYGT